MPSLPAAGSADSVGIYLETVYNGKGVDEAQAGLGKVETEAKVAGEAAGKSAASFESFNKGLKTTGEQAVKVGTSLSIGVSLPIVGIAAESTKLAMNFQQSMEMLHTNAGTAQSAIAGLSDQVLDMARQVGAKPEELAQGLYHIASAGNGIWSTAKQMDILKIAAEGAAIGQASLDDTTYSLTSTMASNIKGAQDAAATMSTLTSIVGAGDMKMSDLNAAIGTGFLGTAATFGLSLRSVGAALATLTDNGEGADAAATRLRMTWALMAAPSKQASDLMQQLGVSADDAQKSTDQMNKIFSQTGLTTTQLATDLKQPNGMNVALKDLQTHMEKAGMTSQETDAILSKMFGGGRSDAALMTLLQNLDRTDEKYKMISDSSQSFADKWAEQQKTAKQQWNTAWDGIQSDMIRLGVVIMPQVTQSMNDIAKGVSDVSKWFNGLSDGQKQFVIDAGGVLAVTGPILLTLGGIAKAMGEIGGLGSSVWKGLAGTDDSTGLFSMIGSLGSKTVDGAKTAGGGIAEMAKNWGGAVADMATAAKDGSVKIASRAVESAKAWTTAGVQMAADTATASGKMVLSAVKSSGAWIAEAHRSEIGLGGTLIKMGVDSAKFAASTAKDAAIASAAWVRNFALASASATKEAAISSAAWVKSATVTSFTWTTQTLPQLLLGFGRTSASAVLNATTTSAAWVASSVKAGAAWVAQTAVAVAQGAIQGAIWLINAGKVAVYTVAIDLAKTSTYLLGGATVAQGALMAGVFAGLVVDIGLVYTAIQSVIGAYQAVQNANAAAKRDQASISNAHDQIVSLSKNGNADQKARANKLLSEGYATGTNYAAGGWRTVGEHGPERMYVPQGAQIKTANESKSMGNGSTTTVTIGNITINTPAAAQEFFRQLNQDTMNLGKGLTAVQGAY